MTRTSRPSTWPRRRACAASCCKADITEPANYRAAKQLDDWLKSAQHHRHLRHRHARADRAASATTACPMASSPMRRTAISTCRRCMPRRRPGRGLDGMDLAKEVSTGQSYNWDETPVGLEQGLWHARGPQYHVVAVDYGVKRNILRRLADRRLQGHRRAGDANGRGHPGAQARRRLPVQRPRRSGGDRRICRAGDPEADRHRQADLRHLPRPPDAGLALGGKTIKMHQGHHGANHPVKDLTTGKVEITSMNHGFAVDRDSLPARRRRDPCLAVRRLQLRPRCRRQADLLGAVPSRSLARPARQPLPLHPLPQSSAGAKGRGIGSRVRRTLRAIRKPPRKGGSLRGNVTQPYCADGAELALELLLPYWPSAPSWLYSSTASLPSLFRST